MRIPPSVIVMSLLTAVPFGLGIRDTLAEKDLPADDDEYGDGLDFGSRRSARERRRELEEYEAEMRREAMERERRAQERTAQLDQLYGAKVASMGTLLDGIVLGADAGTFQPEDVRVRLDRVRRDGFIDVSFDADAHTLNAVEVYITPGYGAGAACSSFKKTLTDAWGPSTNGVWIDSATHQRASFDTAACVLRFDRYVEPTAWVAALPLAAIGSHVDKLVEQVGQSAEVEYDRVYWNMPGLGFGEGATRLEAYIEKDRVVGFQARVATDFDTTVAVREQLATTLGAQPKRDEYTGAWTWKRRVPVALETFEKNKFNLMVGKMPWH